MIRAVPVVLATAVLAGCAHAEPSAATTIAAPRDCPAKTAATRDNFPYPAGLSDVMVAGSPQSALICRYAGLNQADVPGTLERSATISGTDVTEFVTALNDVPAIGPGTFSCPADFASIVLIFFGYANQRAAPVLVNTSGCPSATNGSDSKLFMADAWTPGQQVLTRLDHFVGHEDL